ncbi:MAG: hypothetical protein ACREUQ_07445 [Burkholderiales bacterium]
MVIRDTSPEMIAMLSRATDDFNKTFSDAAHTAAERGMPEMARHMVACALIAEDFGNELHAALDDL